MLIDLSIKINKVAGKDAFENEKMVASGHLGTHTDVMNNEFPIEFTKRSGIVFNVCGIPERDIDVTDIDISLVNADLFVGFYTGFIERQEYGSKAYFTSHPQLSDRLIDQLVENRVSIIGIDCAGVRRSEEHHPKDQYCADRGVFIIENLCNLGKVLNGNNSLKCIINTYPMNLAGMTGLPCRVIAEIL